MQQLDATVTVFISLAILFEGLFGSIQSFMQILTLNSV